MRSSSGSRWRISCGRRSCTRRAPSLAAPRTVTGAGVATATPSQIKAESADYAKSEEKDSSGNRSQGNQTYVNDAMNLLAAAAMFAFREVAFVVTAHLWRQAGNVIAPAR